jgi:ferredoxin
MCGVYSKMDGKLTVTNPESCKPDCPACARICPANAIIFAKSEEERLNGSLDKPVKPSEDDHAALRERLKHRRVPRLFKEE